MLNVPKVHVLLDQYGFYGRMYMKDHFREGIGDINNIKASPLSSFSVPAICR